MRKRLKMIFVCVGSIFLLIAISTTYYQFVSETIYEESAAHLKEIYHQTNQSLHNLVGNNWATMKMWIPYLKDAKDDLQVNAYIEDVQEKIGFTDFYFISREGMYQTNKGEVGYLDMKDQLAKLILQDEDVVVNSVVPGKPEIMVFAVPTEPGTFRGFSYEAIAISFNNDDLVKTLEISSFNGQSSSYVIYPDGRVLVDNTNNAESNVYNFLAMLKSNSNLDSQELQELKKTFLKGKSGVKTFRIRHENYYLVYEPANFENWILIGLVPTDVVNSSMNSLQSSTLSVSIGVSVCLAVVLLAYLNRVNQETLRKKDTELLYREELFSTLSNHVNDIFIMLDKDTFQVNYISPNIEKLVGISEEEVRDDIRNLDQVVNKGQSDMILDHLNDILPGQRGEWDREYVHQKTGEIRWFHVTALCREILDDKKYILAMSDRTKDKMINQKLQEAVNTAESANRAKSTFLSNMSHDIRTPMNAILGFATLASSNVDNVDKVKEYLSKILAAGNHLLSLINDVLDMSHIESGKMRLEETEVNLIRILNNLKTIIEGQIQEKQLQFSIDTSTITDENVLCDEVRLNQALMNLLSNAIKFTPPGGHVSVSIEQFPHHNDGEAIYKIHVKDTGIGMPQEFVERIFEPFERERTSTVSKIQGTGLGMAITKNIVDMMGGSIQVYTEVNKGTEFVIQLTLRLLSQQDHPIQENQNDLHLSDNNDTSIFDGKRLLIVEDNELNREIACEILSEYGFLIDTAHNGVEALDKIMHCQDNEYDLIIMDVQMPIMDGYEATRRIRALDDPRLASIPILAMTANAFEEDRRDAKECGMDGFLSKPINIEEIVAGLKEVFHS